MKSNSKDEKLASELIEEILRLKEQDCIKPTELCVESKDVVETIDMGAICFKICRTGILFHAKSGYSTWISARCVSLFEQITSIFAYLKKFDELSDEQKKSEQETYENVQMTCDAFCHLLQSPIAASISPNILFDTASAYLRVFREETERILSSPLKEETVEDVKNNVQAEQTEEILDAMTAQIKE